MCCSRQKKQLLLPIQIQMQAWVRMGETNLPAALKWDLELESQLSSPSQTGFSCTKLHRSLPGVGITLQWNQCTQGIHAGSSHPSDSEATVCDLSIHQSCIGARDIPASTTQCPVPVMPLPKAFQHPGTTLEPTQGFPCSSCLVLWFGEGDGRINTKKSPSISLHKLAQEQTWL